MRGSRILPKLAVEHNPNIRITGARILVTKRRIQSGLSLDTRKKVDHNATEIPVLRKAQEQYDHDVDEYVRAINKKLGQDVLVTVPVGQAVIALREKIIAGQCPGITEQTALFSGQLGTSYAAHHGVSRLLPFCRHLPTQSGRSTSSNHPVAQSRMG